MVFQDPTDSLNPRFTAARAIADPILRLGNVKGGRAVRARCEELARQVGLPIELLDRFPHQLSGGQKARVGIARAIALNPDLVILDEPTAALDVSVQAVVLNLLQELKEQLGMSYLFVSHDLNVVRLLCDRVIVMQVGPDRRGGADRAGAVRARGAVHPRPAGRHPAPAGVRCCGMTESSYPAPRTHARHAADRRGASSSSMTRRWPAGGETARHYAAI